MNLVLPRYIKQREDYLYYQCDEFQKKITTFIDQHQDTREPYFILFKQNFDYKKPDIAREVLSFYLKRPPLIKGSMVFWVDNTRGLYFRLWSINHQWEIKFNTDGAQKLQQVLRVANG